MSRKIYVGDIHGCLDEFRDLVNLVGPVEGDEVICLGDFLDKGPNGPGCVRFARESGFSAVIGNHEEKHIRLWNHRQRRREDPRYIIPMGVSGALRLENQGLDPEDVAWLDSLPYTHTTEVGSGLPWVAVHGGFMPGRSPEEQAQSKDDRGKIIRLRWLDSTGKHIPVSYEENWQVPSYAHHWADIWDQPFNVVNGHEAHSLSTPQVVQSPGGGTVVGLDTGCVHGGHLTALILDVGAGSYDFLRVKARRVYSKPTLGDIPP